MAMEKKNMDKIAAHDYDSWFFFKNLKNKTAGYNVPKHKRKYKNKKSWIVSSPLKQPPPSYSCQESLKGLIVSIGGY